MYDKEAIKIGERMVKSLIILYMILEACALLYDVFIMDHYHDFLRKLVYISASILFSYLAYKGYKWAIYLLLFQLCRYLLSLICYLIIQVSVLDAINGWLMIAAAILVALMGFCIARLESITEFIGQREMLRKS